MTPLALYTSAIVPAAGLLPALDSPTARVLLLAIAGQESGWMARRQIGGPARSYWQMEQGGAVTNVLTDVRSQPMIRAVCAALDVPMDDIDTVFQAVAWNDVLACCIARMELWLNPDALPAVGNADGAWAFYIATWRPGIPRPDTWPDRYARALTVVSGPAVA